MSIYKNITGNGKGESIVILHGWGCNHQHMQPIVDQLSQQYQVINFDLPGRGKSAWNPKIETIHDIADQLLDHLPEKATYIGWSFGGHIAMSIASRFPERVEKIVGIATTPKFIEDKNWLGVPQPGFIAGFGEIKKIGAAPMFTQFYNSEFAHYEQKPKAYHELLALLNNDEINLDILLKGVNIIDHSDLRKEFSNIQCPIELILGGKDDNVNIENIPSIKALNSRVNIHVIPEAKHVPFWVYPNEFNHILKSIL